MRRRLTSALVMIAGICAFACGAFSGEGVATEPTADAGPGDAVAAPTSEAGVDGGPNGPDASAAAKPCGWDRLEAGFDSPGAPAGWDRVTEGAGVELVSDATVRVAGTASLRVEMTGKTLEGPRVWFRRALTYPGIQKPGCLHVGLAVRRASAWAPSGAVVLGVSFGTATLNVGFDAGGRLELAEQDLDGTPYITLGKTSVDGEAWIPVTVDVDLALGTVAWSVNGQVVGLSAEPSLIRDRSPSQVEVGALWTGGNTSTFWLDDVVVE